MNMREGAVGVALAFRCRYSIVWGGLHGKIPRGVDLYLSMMWMERRKLVPE